MKPYGLYYVVDGCICSLCRARGYRKGNGFESLRRAGKHRSRQAANADIREVLQ